MIREERDVVVVGGGIGGLCAGVILAAGGRNVSLLEASHSLGGKAGTELISGVEVDTGPSVLTLPNVFEEVFQAAGMVFRDEVRLRKLSPGFRYLYPDGVTLDVFHELEDTLDSVHKSLGSNARSDLETYMSYAEDIWNAAAPHFVMSEAPEFKGIMLGGLRTLRAVAKIDPWNSLRDAIKKRVRSLHLQKLLMRYATYNGSDARSCPATLGCIAHVELALGGFGVEGGMSELVRGLERAAQRVGVVVELEAKVQRICQKGSAVCGVELAGGRRIHAPQVVMNGDVGSLNQGLLEKRAPKGPKVPSMSAFNGVFQAKRRSGAEARIGHTVVFPEDYDAEFADIFDQQRAPTDPTIYLCAQEVCHGRTGWKEHEPVFCMVNTPPTNAEFLGNDDGCMRQLICDRLRRVKLLEKDDVLCWWRTPRDLAAQFPGSHGALYGAASNSAVAAFQRPANRVKGIEGLFLASGSAHPGGGVPMVAQSGKLAARAAMAERKEGRQ